MGSDSLNRDESCMLTIAGPGQLLAKLWLLLLDLEPNSTLTSEALDVLAVRNSGKVELHGSRVVDVGGSAIRDGGASSDAESGLSRAVGRLEASDLVGVHIVDKAVVLPVIGPANVLPVGSRSAVRPHLREGVVGAGAGRGGEEKSDRGKHDMYAALKFGKR